MSGNTTVSGTTVVSQFTASAGSPAALAALDQLGNLSFSVASVNGSFGTTGPVSVGSGVTAATITSANVVLSSAPNASLTVSSPAAQVFAAPGDTVTASGADTLFASATGTTTFLSSGANSSIVGGTGNLTATASGANTTLIGGTGITNFTVSGAGSDAVAGPSPGVTNITLAETTGGAQIATNPLGNSGTLVATLSQAGADTVVGGGGASTITGGAGADVFGFVDGHAGGTETILNFTSKDTFAFGGYGTTAISNEVFSVTNASTGVGNDVITLSDGTVINVVGVDAKIF
jgi:hypothetical protein